MDEQMLTQQFEEVLAGCQALWAKAQVREGGSWYPPVEAGHPRRYECELVEIRKGVFTDEATGWKTFWFQPVFRILQGEFENRTFRGDMYRIKNCPPESATELDYGNASRAKTFIAVLAGGEVADTEILPILNAAAGPPGAVLGVTVAKSKNPNYKWPNVWVNERLDVADPVT